jgi:hypothetical protein
MPTDDGSVNTVESLAAHEIGTAQGKREHGKGSAMNTTSPVFDPELQMFIEQPRGVDLAHLRFLRWLAEHGQLEHETAGPSVGEYS